ncbi:MAG: hypothetical protein O9284_19055 [Steroidobacteraceae bacterium]|jgi:putative intracellular protease/amidase|nr:hypothetical protein [Steroidobacteraceae bacterium]
MKTTIHVRLAAAMLGGLLLAACGSQMEPAQKALAEIEAAVTASANEAAKYIPNRAEEVNAKLAEIKAAFEKGDYVAVITGAPALLTEAKALAVEAATKKQEFFDAINQQWGQLSSGMPQAVAAIEAQIAKYEQAAQLPEGVTRQAVTDAKQVLADAKTTWAEATTAFGEGRLEEAISKGSQVQARAQELMESLKVPGAAATAAPAPAPAPAG